MYYLPTTSPHNPPFFCPFSSRCQRKTISILKRGSAASFSIGMPHSQIANYIPLALGSSIEGKNSFSELMVPLTWCPLAQLYQSFL